MILRHLSLMELEPGCCMILEGRRRGWNESIRSTPSAGQGPPAVAVEQKARPFSRKRLNFRFEPAFREGGTAADPNDRFRNREQAEQPNAGLEHPAADRFNRIQIGTLLQSSSSPSSRSGSGRVVPSVGDRLQRNHGYCREA